MRARVRSRSSTANLHAEFRLNRTPLGEGRGFSCLSEHARHNHPEYGIPGGCGAPYGIPDGRGARGGAAKSERDAGAPESEERFSVALASGAVEVSAAFCRPEGAWATIAIAHGAGAGYRHPFLLGFARGMHHQGVATLRFNFPYVEAGRRMPGPAAHAVTTWSVVMDSLADGGTPVWAAGKSYGGRMASMAAAEGAIAPAGLVYLGYPLHPPGDPAKARVAHLPAVAQPQLFVEGTNDPFIDPHLQLEEAVASCRDASIAWIEGGGHSFEVKGRKRPADEVGAALAPPVADWMRRLS